MKVLFIHHAGLQHALHIYHVAQVLADRGVEGVIAVAGESATLAELGPVKTKAIEYAQALSGNLGFKDGGGPDLIHAWTPARACERINGEAGREIRLSLYRSFGGQRVGGDGR